MNVLIKIFLLSVCLIIGVILPLCGGGSAVAAPTDWICYDEGLPPWTVVNGNGNSSESKLLTFDRHIYAASADGTQLFVQLYNTPCLGWRAVKVPDGTAEFKAVGSYLYASAQNLWWIGTGGGSTAPNWQQVTSTGLPDGAIVHPQTIFQGQLYASVSNTSGTFDVYRTPDIGKTAMTWTKVVDAGFGDSLNHELGVLIEYNNTLIAITSNTRTNSTASFGDYQSYGTGIEVWESSSGNLDSWNQVNEDGFGTEAPNPKDSTKTIRTNQDFGSAIVYGEHLYIGTKAHFKNGQIWRYDGSGLGGWTDVSPNSMCNGWIDDQCQGPSRASDMAVYNGLLYLAEGFPTAKIDTFDGTSWSIAVGSEDSSLVSHPFNLATNTILSLAVLPSLPTPNGKGTGDKLFALTGMDADNGHRIQVWSYPFSTWPLTCNELDTAMIEITPETASSELFPGATHTFTVNVFAVDSINFTDVWVPMTTCVEQHYGGGGGKQCSDGGAVPADGPYTETYPAWFVEPSGLTTDNIEACFFKPAKPATCSAPDAPKCCPTPDAQECPAHWVCANATHTWVDTTPPEIAITTPADGAKYLLNAEVLANYSVNDAVGVKSTNAPVANGAAIPTNSLGTQSFIVTATDYSGNTSTRSVKYQVQSPSDALQDMVQEALATVQTLPPAAFKNSNMQQGFVNQLNTAVTRVNLGKYDSALHLVRGGILVKTDGCAASGKPDKNDWLKDCADQATVYELLMEAIECLESMI